MIIKKEVIKYLISEAIDINSIDNIKDILGDQIDIQEYNKSLVVNFIIPSSEYQYKLTIKNIRNNDYEIIFGVLIGDEFKTTVTLNREPHLNFKILSVIFSFVYYHMGKYIGNEYCMDVMDTKRKNIYVHKFGDKIFNNYDKTIINDRICLIRKII